MYIVQKLNPLSHECQVGLNGCSEHAQCTNIRGGYRCECIGDFYGTGLSCQCKLNFLRVFDAE